MKLLRYGTSGAEKPGMLDAAGRIRDLSAHVEDFSGAALSPTSMQRLRSIDIDALPIIQDDVRIGPCVAGVGTFFGIGLNYADHAKEAGLELPKEPIIFTKWTNCICGPNDDVIKPHDSQKLDWEAELGIVIGKGGRYIDEANVSDHIAGYCLVNDISERYFQFERGGGQWDKGKGSETFGPIGPWLVTPDEVNIDDLDIKLSVNGKRYQSGNTRTMVFKPHFLVSYLSCFVRLSPGDVITTGTPPGVGMGQKPPVFLNAGDEMVLSITGLGEQKQRVVAEP